MRLFRQSAIASFVFCAMLWLGNSTSAQSDQSYFEMAAPHGDVTRWHGTTSGAFAQLSADQVTLTVTSNVPAGLVSVLPQKVFYSKGETVRLTPFLGQIRFIGWSEDASA